MVNNHHDHWSNSPWIYWFVLGGVSVIFALFEIDWGEGGVLGWIDKHSSLAAWVQAVSTILALTIAIGIPWYIHRNETRDRRKATLHQGQAVALLIQHQLHILEGEIKRVIDPRSASDFATGSRDFKDLAVEVPGVIRGQIDRLWLMGSAGGCVLHLVSILEANKRTVEEGYRLATERPDQGESVGRLIELSKKNLKIAVKELENARTAIHMLLRTEP